jgi:transposase
MSSTSEAAYEGTASLETAELRVQLEALRARLDAEQLAFRERLDAEQLALATERARVAELVRERDVLRAAHERLRLELELLRRRIFVAKAERVDTAQLELEFAFKLAELDKLGGGAEPSERSPEPEPDARRKKARPTGRRDLDLLPIEEERVELFDPLFEDLVAAGKVERMGFEESRKLAWKRGGMRRLVVARAKYRAFDAAGETVVETTPMPPESMARSLAAPSLVAHIAAAKHCEGMPLYRIEDRFAREGAPVDRGTMSRWLEDCGATLGATVVAAMKADALRNAFCIATDATGVAIQPIATHEKKRQSCRRGHYFVLVADRDHVLFEYTEKESSAFVSEMLRGFRGYVQADAKSVYDALFREPDPDDPDDDPSRTVPREVGCWAHARRKFWEAATAKIVTAREGLARIGRIFELDAQWRGKPPAEVARLRDQRMRTHIDAFFDWADLEYARVRDERGMLRSALGYAVRQQAALRRVLDDGRLPLDNNRSERELRRIAVGRKAWLFSASDDHAVSAGNLFSLVASARLHRLDPEAYLRDLLRVVPHWPRDRFLELAPLHWANTRARLLPAELDSEIGPLTLPSPHSPEQPSPG